VPAYFLNIKTFDCSKLKHRTLGKSNGFGSFSLHEGILISSPSSNDIKKLPSDSDRDMTPKAQSPSTGIKTREPSVHAFSFAAVKLQFRLSTAPRVHPCLRMSLKKADRHSISISTNVFHHSISASSFIQVSLQAKKSSKKRRRLSEHVAGKISTSQPLITT
jgi:hypothetical protein